MAFKDIRKSRPWISPQEIRIIVVFLLIISALLALNVYLARTVIGGEWLLMRWNAIRSFIGLQLDTSVGFKAWREMTPGHALPPGETVILRPRPNTYGGGIAHPIQEVVYGRKAFATEYKYILSDPFPLVLLYTPLAFLSNFTITRAIWMLFHLGNSIFKRISITFREIGVHSFIFAIRSLTFFSGSSIIFGESSCPLFMAAFFRAPGAK